MKLNLIYYKNVLDLSLAKFFEMHNDSFTKQGNEYVFSLGMSKKSLESLFMQLVSQELHSMTQDDRVTRDKYILIGTCYPKDSLLLDIKGDSYVPKKILDAIEKTPSMKWLLVEDGISIDIEMVNSIFVDIFNQVFNSQRGHDKVLGPHRSNVIAIAHSSLDCYMMFKTIKWAYGSANCRNVWKEDVEDTTGTELTSLLRLGPYTAI